MKKQWGIFLVVCINISFLMTGCKMTGEMEPKATAQTGIVQEENTATEENEKEENKKEENKKEQKEQVLVYVGNGNADNFLIETEQVSEMTGETVFGALQKQGVIPENVTYQSFQQKEENGKVLLTLDLSENFQEYVSKMGTAGEYLIMQGIANTYLTAFHGDSIKITVDNKTIGTGHALYEDPLELEIFMPEHIENMIPVLDSLMRCMLESGAEYDAKDDSFYWNAIFYLASGYGDLHGLCEFTENEMSAPKQVVSEYATALFYDFRDLPSIPEKNKNNIRYVPEEEKYYFTLGDIGLSNTKIIQCEAGEKEGSYVIYAELYDSIDKKAIKTYRFVVNPNPYVDGIAEPVFYYSVASIEEVK